MGQNTRYEVGQVLRNYPNTDTLDLLVVAELEHGVYLAMHDNGETEIVWDNCGWEVIA